MLDSLKFFLKSFSCRTNFPARFKNLDVKVISVSLVKYFSNSLSISSSLFNKISSKLSDLSFSILVLRDVFLDPTSPCAPNNYVIIRNTNEILCVDLGKRPNAIIATKNSMLPATNNKIFDLNPAILSDFL